ncbi:MAG: ankyrin repeat domain-containing protein [Campylobacterota bacterium]|nr:ankyrin repeat domain-containing protein [Campylobacterota bacterium]
MLKKLFCKLNPTIDNLKEEVLKHPFELKMADSIFSSGKIDINEKDYNDKSLLYLALEKNRFVAAKWLIENKIDTTFGEGNESALRTSVNKESYEVVESLIKNTKQNINQVDKQGRTLLQDAVILGNRKLVHLLLDSGIDVNILDNKNRNVMFDAIAYGDNKIINLLLGTNVNLSVVDSDGDTIINHPLVLKDDELATKLIEKGADVTVCDEDGNNFLTNIALRGEKGEAILNCAIQNGCNVNSKVANSNSVLMEVMFAFSKHQESDKDINYRKGLKNIAEKLIDSGLDVEAINDDGETALFDAIRSGDIEACQFLLNYDVPINHINKNSETALLLAIYKGISNLSMIKLLLENGADILIKDKHNRTIPEILNIVILNVHGFKPMEDPELLDRIDSAGNYMVILKEILDMNKWDLNFLNSEGEPLFFTSFLNNDNKTCQLYLKAKLDINMKDKDGLTLFYKYVLDVFEENIYFDEFRDKLIFLLINKANNNVLNAQGQSIYTKVALGPCNLQLFRKLTEVARHDYKSVDSQGRTILHSCVWSGNLELLKLVYGVDRNIQNIPDNYNILPITYAALLGNKNIVEEFLRRDTIVTSGKPIPKAVQEKFKPMLKNLPKLWDGIEDKNYLRKLKILAQQVTKDFLNK